MLCGMKLGIQICNEIWGSDIRVSTEKNFEIGLSPNFFMIFFSNMLTKF